MHVGPTKGSTEKFIYYIPLIFIDLKYKYICIYCDLNVKYKIFAPPLGDPT